MLRSGVQSAPRRHKAGTVACGIPARTELASVQRWPQLLLTYVAGFFDGELRERYDDRMGTTINLPDTLVNEVKVRADHEGQSLDDAAADLIRKGLAVGVVPPVSGPRPVIHTDPRSGFPYIECPPDAPARHMTISELLAFEQETLAQEDRERIGLSRRQ
jgi:hypothetical protein